MPNLLDFFKGAACLAGVNLEMFFLQYHSCMALILWKRRRERGYKYNAGTTGQYMFVIHIYLFTDVTVTIAICAMGEQSVKTKSYNIPYVHYFDFVHL